MPYHCSKRYTVYKRDIIQVVVWSGVICTTTVQNYTFYTVYKRDIIQVVVWNRVICTTTVENCTLSTSATLYRWLFGAVLVALPLIKTIHCLQARHCTGGCLEPCYLHYHCSKLYTVYKCDVIQVGVWSRVSCTNTVQNYTLSTSATLCRWLFGAVLVALPLFKTIHCLQARHYAGGCLERC